MNDFPWFTVLPERDKMTKSKRVPKSICPFCDYHMDAAMPTTEGTEPSCGDIGICLSCSQILEYDKNLELVAIPQEKINQMFEEDKDFAVAIRKYQSVIRQMDRTGSDKDLQNEAVNKKLDWFGGSHYCNWRRYVGPNVREIWSTLTDDQKIAIARDAKELAKDLEYE